MEDTAIPKIIHYCWFGNGVKPKIAIKCIESWREKLPEYQIIEWNENNFNLKVNKYVEQAYLLKKYAFVSDYARYYVLYNYGGIYMDIDVEVLKPLDIFLNDTAFTGFENDYFVATGLILGSIANVKIIEDLMNGYDNREFLGKDGKVDLTTVVEYTTKVLIDKGLEPNGLQQNVEGMKIYPTNYFCPKQYSTGKCHISTNTYTIHHYNGSWKTPCEKLKTHFSHIVGINCMRKLSKLKQLFLKVLVQR